MFNFELEGSSSTRSMAPHVSFTPAISMFILVRIRTKSDYYWTQLSAAER